MKSEQLIGIATVLFIVGIALHSQSGSAAGSTDSEAVVVDLEYGEEINETCAACHGEYGEGMPDSEYPRLAGLPEGYIAKQLRDFKTRARLNIPMLPYTSERELPEQDLVSVAAYLEQIKLPSRLPPIDENNFDAFARLQQSKRVVNIARLDGNLQAGERLYQKDCSSCHARDGYGKAAKQIPPLAGQHSAYLRRQFQKFRSGERLHDDDPDDKALFEEIGDAQVHDILSYLSILDDG
jgi:cytochrome c553